jgi:hypothetical protein
MMTTSKDAGFLVLSNPKDASRETERLKALSNTCNEHKIMKAPLGDRN